VKAVPFLPQRGLVMPSPSVVVANSEDLEQAIANYTMQGFMTVNRTDGSAVLRKPKQFNVLLGVIGFLFCGVGLLVYAIIYSFQSDKVVEIRVRSEGQSELRLSDDRRWWWDGEQWVDSALRVPPGARRSDDDQHWWDGMSWRPVPAPERMWTTRSLGAATAPGIPDSAGSGTTMERPDPWFPSSSRPAVEAERDRDPWPGGPALT
jgi:hypothetical protein